MEIQIYSDRNALAAAAAQQAATAIEKAISRQGHARIIAATAASQKEFLQNLAATRDIDWSGVEAFHLDEYIGLPMSHPGSFRRMLKEQLIDKTGITKHHLLHGDGDLAAVISEASVAIAAAPIDIAFLGIGENGHLAFNDPPADFDTEAPYLVVELDEACRRQQVGEAWFADLSQVPQKAISMSIRQILKARELVVVVPGRQKAEAIRACFGGDVTPLAPASILRTHANVTVYLDGDSAALLDLHTRLPQIEVADLR
jgi:glucosamine-6-phosphate deaminase